MQVIDRNQPGVQVLPAPGALRATPRLHRLLLAVPLVVLGMLLAIVFVRVVVLPAHRTVAVTDAGRPVSSLYYDGEDAVTAIETDDGSSYLVYGSFQGLPPDRGLVVDRRANGDSFLCDAARVQCRPMLAR